MSKIVHSRGLARLAIVFLGSVLLAGCSPDTITQSPGVGSPAFNFADGPSSPGPYIVRINNSGSRVITTDPENGLLAIHGRVKNLSECTDASTRVPVDIQIVNTPSDAQGLTFLLTGTENDVAIYGEGDIADLAPFDPAKFCPFINSTTPLYEGVVHYRLLRNGQGSLNFQWEGELTRLSDGAAVHYVERQHFVAQGDGTGKWVTESIMIIG